MNKKDENGFKQGYWEEESWDKTEYGSYLNDYRQGTWRIYNKVWKSLNDFEIYDNGLLVSSVYYILGNESEFIEGVYLNYINGYYRVHEEEIVI